MLKFSQFNRINESHPSYGAFSIFLTFSGALKDAIKEYSNETGSMGGDPKILKRCLEEITFAPSDEDTSLLTIKFFKDNGVYSLPAAEIFFGVFRSLPVNLIEKNFPGYEIEEIIKISNRTLDKFKLFLSAQEKSQKFNKDKFLTQRPDSKMEGMRKSVENRSKILDILNKIYDIKVNLDCDDLYTMSEDKEQMEIVSGMFDKLLDGGRAEILSKFKNNSPKIFGELSKSNADKSALDDTMTLGDLGFDT